MKRKVLALILIAVMAVAAFTACDKNKDADYYTAKVEGAIFGGQSDDSIVVAVKFNPDWITKDSNRTYHKNLAGFSALLSADSYFREKDLEKGTQNRVLFDDSDASKYTFTTMLETLGFQDVKHIESFKEKNYETDVNDSVTMNIGYMTQGKNNIFVVAIRGCFSSGEWMSVFDVGTEEVLKGVRVAAERAVSFIDEYMGAHADPKKQNCILITGHSRGGNIAQVVGAHYEDDKKVKSMTYAFNTSPVTTNKQAESYQTIYNVYDSSDQYSDVMPFANETFYRYGKVISMDLNDSQRIVSIVGFLKDRGDYVSVGKELLEKYREFFGNCFKDRASLEKDQGHTETFDDEEKAKARLTELTELLGSEKGLGLIDYFTLGEIEKTDDGKYRLQVNYQGKAKLQAIGKIYTYGSTAYEAVKSVFAQNSGLLELAEYVDGLQKEISGGHLLVNSYVLALYYEN